MNNIYWESFKTFFKIGMFTLGGGYAMIPIIEEEVVNRHRWVDKEEMLDLIAIAQSCPGVFAINISSSSTSLKTTATLPPCSGASALLWWR